MSKMTFLKPTKVTWIVFVPVAAVTVLLPLLLIGFVGVLWSFDPGGPQQQEPVVAGEEIDTSAWQPQFQPSTTLFFFLRMGERNWLRARTTLLAGSQKIRIDLT